MSEKNIRIPENITAKNVDVASRSYKELLYELLEDPEFEKEYLDVCLEDKEYPQAYPVALKNVAEAKKHKEVRQGKKQIELQIKQNVLHPNEIDYTNNLISELFSILNAIGSNTVRLVTELASIQQFVNESNQETEKLKPIAPFSTKAVIDSKLKDINYRLYLQIKEPVQKINNIFDLNELPTLDLIGKIQELAKRDYETTDDIERLKACIDLINECDKTLTPLHKQLESVTSDINNSITNVNAKTFGHLINTYKKVLDWQATILEQVSLVKKELERIINAQISSKIN
jgi:hypothetical protein